VSPSPRLLTRLSAIPVTELDGVGAKREDALKMVGVESVLDLLMYYPRRYIDRTAQVMIDQMAIGEQAMVLARVDRIAGRRTQKGRSLVEARVSDDSGSLKVTFFNQPWRTKQLLEGQEAIFFGKLDEFRGQKQMTNPIVDLIGNKTGRIVPVYPQSDKAGLSSWEIADWIEEALQRAGEFADPLPDELRERLQLSSRTWAMRNVHVPESMQYAYASRKRLAFDELFRLQTILVLRKRAIERESRGLQHDVQGSLVKAFIGALPYSLTGAQQRAIDEVSADLAKPQPMHRLLQGDVGSGKTMVAVASLLVAVQGGHQGALMAPTEVLAEQHFFNVRALVQGLMIGDAATLMGERHVRVELLTNRTTAAERRKLHAGLQTGEVDILIGTHALLTDAVEFHSLGVVVIDEQHRFGVEQRAALREKGRDGAVPDVLVMTATPIPRTAAMTVYGDLDVTLLDELPPGRTPIETMWAQTRDEEEQAWKKVRTEIEAGRQAYVVCPLVETSERVQAKSATEEYERLQHEVFPDLRVGLIHGQLKAPEKEAVMNAFRSRELDVLVATTVIEVGVDVPNATVMVIENASRFGIAQLHQLRGRVGRGAERSYCYLLEELDEESDNENAAERLEAMVASTDGFELAEVDLELRGAGTVLGARQKGRSDLKLASLKKRDRDLVQLARDVAFEIIDVDPFLEHHEILADDIKNLVDDDEAEFLFKG
jgi:ATP-dependent DNA helicase RecG